MPRENDQTLKVAIERMLNTYRLKHKVQETRIISHWEEIVGQTIGRYTEDVFVRNRKLFIQMRNPAMRHEMMYSRDKLVRLVNDHLGEELIDEVIIK